MAEVGAGLGCGSPAPAPPGPSRSASTQGDRTLPISVQTPMSAPAPPPPLPWTCALSLRCSRLPPCQAGTNPRWAGGQQRPWRTALASHAPSLPWAGSTPYAFGTPCRDTLNPPCFQATWVISNVVADQEDTASFTGRRTVLKIKDTLGPLTPLLPWLWNRHLLSDGFQKARSQVEASGLAVTALLGEVTGVASKVFEVHTLH